jgi:hypothetical protein
MGALTSCQTNQSKTDLESGIAAATQSGMFGRAIESKLPTLKGLMDDSTGCQPKISIARRAKRNEERQLEDKAHQRRDGET